MCNQTVSLVAAELERRGITTVCLMLLREVAEKVRPPRALVVPYRHGYPLGEPDDAALQTRIVTRALELATDGERGPVVVEAETTDEG